VGVSKHGHSIFGGGVCLATCYFSTTFSTVTRCFVETIFRRGFSFFWGIVLMFVAQSLLEVILNITLESPLSTLFSLVLPPVSLWIWRLCVLRMYWLTVVELLDSAHTDSLYL
jgi:hypothetical protein